jgi:hypothetical protein
MSKQMTDDEADFPSIPGRTFTPVTLDVARRYVRRQLKADPHKSRDRIIGNAMRDSHGKADPAMINAIYDAETAGSKA